MLGRDKRELVAQFLHRAGVLRLLENCPFTDSLLVLTYHRIVDPRDCGFDRGVISATPEQFYEQVSYLKTHFDLIGLSELLDHVEGGKPVSGFRTMITFDDGYIDQYQNAFPILRNLQIPAVFFLPTSYIGTSRIPWWDQIADLLRRSRNQTIYLDYPEERNFSLDESSLEEIIRQVLPLYKSPAVRDTERFLEMMERECGVTRLEIADPPLFLNWEQAREMLDGGMEIGSHTHSHRVLAHLSDESQVEELSKSRELLERHLSSARRSLAIPSGSRQSFNAATERALRQTDYQMAFSYYGGVNRANHMHRFDIRRMGVHPQMSFALLRWNALLAATTGWSW